MKQALQQALILAVLSLVGMGGTWLFHPDLPPWNPLNIEKGEIAIADALALQNAVWIDARTESEYLTNHIPGALNLNEEKWEKQFEKFIAVWDGQSSLIVYCDSRTCDASKQVAQRLMEALGTEEVFVLKGGWQTWLKEKN